MNMEGTASRMQAKGGLREDEVHTPSEHSRTRACYKGKEGQRRALCGHREEYQQEPCGERGQRERLDMEYQR